MNILGWNIIICMSHVCRIREFVGRLGFPLSQRFILLCYAVDWLTVACQMLSSHSGK